MSILFALSWACRTEGLPEVRAMPADADADGYTTADDCDDADPDVHPGATELRCANDADEDCDGEVDESADGARCMEDAAVTWIQEQDDSHADGAGLSIAGDVDGDGRSDLLLAGGGGWAPDLAGHVHVFLSANLEEGVVPAASADWTLPGEEGTQAGSGLLSFSAQGATFLPDLDGDGRSELFVGAPLAEEGVGAAYVVLAEGLDGASSSLATLAWTELVDESASSQELGGVSAAGDVDGDGVGDLLLAGDEVVWVVPASAISGARTDVGAGVRLDGPDTAWRSYFGEAVVEAGDLDGDGLSDVGVGCSVGGDEARGQVLVFLGASLGSATLPSTAADITLAGSPAVLGFGYGLAAGPDLDGDGVPDLVVGTLGAEAADGVYVFSGAAGLAGGVLTEGDAFAHLVPEEAERGRFGTALSLGDHDGDGAADVVVQDNDEDERFFLFANATLRGGTVASSAADWIYEPHDADTIVGGGVRLDGDLDGDGAAEFVYADASWGPYGYDSGFGMAMVFPSG